jgi:hypothetical protein
VGSEKDQLIQRVTDRWQCLVQNDYVCAYDYTTPAYRDVFSQDLYKIGKGSMLERRLTGAKVVNYDSDAAVASVEVGVMSRPFKHTSSASRTLGPRFTTIRRTVDMERWYVVVLRGFVKLSALTAGCSLFSASTINL